MSNVKIAKSNLKTKARATKDDLFYFDKGKLTKIKRKDIVYKDEDVGEAIDALKYIKKVLGITCNFELIEKGTFLVLEDKKFLNVIFNKDKTIKSINEIVNLIPNQKVPKDIFIKPYKIENDKLIVDLKEFRKYT